MSDDRETIESFSAEMEEFRVELRGAIDAIERFEAEFWATIRLSDSDEIDPRVLERIGERSLEDAIEMIPGMADRIRDLMLRVENVQTRLQQVEDALKLRTETE